MRSSNKQERFLSQMKRSWGRFLRQMKKTSVDRVICQCFDRLMGFSILDHNTRWSWNPYNLYVRTPIFMWMIIEVKYSRTIQITILSILIHSNLCLQKKFLFFFVCVMHLPSNWKKKKWHNLLQPSKLLPIIIAKEWSNSIP